MHKHSFASIMAISLNLLPLKVILSSRKIGSLMALNLVCMKDLEHQLCFFVSWPEIKALTEQTEQVQGMNSVAP